MIYGLFTKDYFLIFILIFPLVVWALKGKIFSLKKISFNETKVFINDNEYSLDEIESVCIKAFELSFLKIKGKKHYFSSPFTELKGNYKKEILLKRIEMQKNKTQHNTA
jgi:hypothetical protein